MTRDKLLDIVARYSKTLDWDSVLVAVDAYSAALLRQTDVSSSADVLMYIGVTDVAVALKAFSIMKAAGYVPQDKFDEAVKLAKMLK